MWAGTAQSVQRIARSWRSGDGILVEARYSPPAQTAPATHSASYTMGTGSYPGVKLPGCGVDHPPPSSAKVKERVELYLCSTSGPSWPVIGYSLPLLQRNILGRSPNVYTSSAVVLVFMVI
jgi:hypothetical protein